MWNFSWHYGEMKDDAL
jgi:hypothetical protein